MKTLRDFVLKIDMPISETLKYGTLELYTPEYVTRHNEYGNMNNYGEVTSIPMTYKEGNVDIGDRIYVHHNIVINKKNVQNSSGIQNNNFCIDEEQNLYRVQYEEKGRNNLAYVVVKKDGSMFTIGDVVLCERNNAVDESEVVSGIFLQRKLNNIIESKVKVVNKELQKLGVNVGDTVGSMEHSDYEFDVEGEKCWRMFNTDIQYVLDKDGNKKMLGNWMLIETDEDESMVGSFFKADTHKTVNQRATVVSAGEECEQKAGDRILLISIGKLAPQTPAHDNRLFMSRGDNIAGFIS